MGAAALVALPLALAAGQLPTAAPTLMEGANLAALVTLGSLLPFALYAYGQKHVTAEVAGAFVNLEPLVGAALGAIVFHDPFSGMHAAAAERRGDRRDGANQRRLVLPPLRGRRALP